MASDVVIMVADAMYLDHAKYAMVNFRRQGQWTGDFCVISPGACDTSDLERRGIIVLHVPDAQWDFMVKFHAFTEFFHRWERALCVDVDIMVQGPVQKIFDGLGPRLPSMFASLEDGPIIDGLRYWDKTSGEGPDAHPEVYTALEAKYPHVTKRMFNMGILFYSPKSMPPSTMAELRAVDREFKKANPTNADQMLVNLHLYDRLVDAPKDYWCFFGCDYPENRVASEFRKWRGDEEPVILHYTRWHAPWIVKRLLSPEMGGYRNHRLGRLCHELYAENLAAFPEVFPVL